MIDFCVVERVFLVVYSGSGEYSSIYLRYSAKIQLTLNYLRVGWTNFFFKAKYYSPAADLELLRRYTPKNSFAA